MLIGNKVFPYPLLRDKDSNTDYKTTQFCFDFEMDNGIPMIVNGNLILKNISFYLDNPELKELYADGFVKAICEVECSNTVYREFFEITESPQTKKIPITNFANIVTISAYLVATKEICAFISTDFVDDYEGYSFHINPSNVLAADITSVTSFLISSRSNLSAFLVFFFRGLSSLSLLNSQSVC